MSRTLISWSGIAALAGGMAWITAWNGLSIALVPALILAAIGLAGLAPVHTQYGGRFSWDGFLLTSLGFVGLIFILAEGTQQKLPSSLIWVALLVAAGGLIRIGMTTLRLAWSSIGRFLPLTLGIVGILSALLGLIGLPNGEMDLDGGSPIWLAILTLLCFWGAGMFLLGSLLLGEAGRDHQPAN